ncbi:hypothetical protein HYALB_00009909 [Hymenoscyphus albidus]|uniref:Uncharacterized protein n=1 Tax=Hymenoscyphus albidus TaxID=595503 RepID=A0A9N9Q918_9HELO|nr:hypothetical protein HYALB_00009909 [Hymenoscyphus albidus]
MEKFAQVRSISVSQTLVVLVSAVPAIVGEGGGTATAGQVKAESTDASTKPTHEAQSHLVMANLAPALSMIARGQYHTCSKPPASFTSMNGFVGMAGGTPSCWLFADASYTTGAKIQDVKSDGIGILEDGVRSIFYDAPATRHSF